MTKPDIKESIQTIVQKLGFLKNYTSLIAPVSICIAGIIVLVLNQMMVGKLGGQIKTESLRAGDDVRNLLETAVSKDQWKEEQKYQTAYRQDANEIVSMINQSSQRSLLSYKLFPYPIDKSSLIFEEFGEKFRSGIESILDKINAGNCPGVEELTKHLQGSARGEGNPTGGYAPSTEVDIAIRDVLCLDKAKSASVYVDPLIVSGYDFWREYQNPGAEAAIDDCWFWQLGYWIIDDVFETVGKVNYGSANVFASPVKRVMNIGFYGTESADSPGGEESYSVDGVGGTGAVVTADNVKPSYALAGGGWLKETCTGRFCNADIDVVHFKLSVLVDTRAVSDFMKELCSAKEHSFQGFSGKEPAKTFKHNQITILKYSSKPISLENQLHILYRYGEDAVVQLDLTCEYVLVKSGYDAIKPESIKKLLTTPDMTTMPTG